MKKNCLSYNPLKLMQPEPLSRQRQEKVPVFFCRLILSLLFANIAKRTMSVFLTFLETIG